MRARILLSQGLACVLGVAWCTHAHAVSTEVTEVVADSKEEEVADGVYGRFDGDLDFGLGLGAELESHAPRGALRFTAHYFAIAGVYATYRNGFSENERTDAQVLSLGVDVRPAFVPRWARNMQQGPAFLDLWLDSISLGLGGYWSEPAFADFGDVRGFETSLGFGLPLFGTARGLWLEARGLMRFPDIGERRDSVLLALSWHTFLLTPLSE